jgi:hypothetical protein
VATNGLGLGQRQLIEGAWPNTLAAPARAHGPNSRNRWMQFRRSIAGCGNMFRMGAGSELVARIVVDMHAHGLEPDAKKTEL